MDSVFWLSLVVFLPAIGALVITIFPRDATEWIKIFTLIITALVFVITVAIAGYEQ